MAMYVVCRSVMVQVGVLVVGVSGEETTTIEKSLNTAEIWFVSTEAEAVACVQAHPSIRIALLDFSSSVSLLQTLSHYPIHSIVLTSDNTMEERKALALGASDCLQRPYSPELLNIRVGLLAKCLMGEEENVLFDSLLWQAPVGIAVYSRTNATHVEMVKANAILLDIMGRTKEELMTIDWKLLTHPEDLEKELVKYAQFSNHEISGYEIEKRFIKPDGSLVWVNMTVSRLYVNQPEAEDYLGIIKDITEQKELEASLRERERIIHSYFSQLPGMAYRCAFDEHWTMQFVSSGCKELTGYLPEELVGNKVISFNEMIAPIHRDNVREEWESIINGETPFIQEYEIITKDGDKRWVFDTGRGIQDDQGAFVAIEGMLFDISERKRQELILNYYHNHDEWTDLPNRRFLVSFLEEEQKKRGNALLAVNLTAVHALSVAHGFLYSRNLVKQVAMKLQALSDSEHVLFSSYEYQMIFFIKAPVDFAALLSFGMMVSKKVASLLREERVGWGIGLIELSEAPVEEILTNLLVASEQALSDFDTGHEVCVFDEAMQQAMRRRTTIERELAELIKNPVSSSLSLQFQPIWDVKTQTISGFEALSRMKSPSLGSVSPTEFIEIAEKAKLIVPLGKIIIDKALRFLSLIEKEGFPGVGVSINISAIQLMNKDFLPSLMKAVEHHRVDTENITLEVTESVFISKFQEVNDLFLLLQQLGMSIAIDDFGTGYSTLSRERELNVNCLKIDKAFIDKLEVLQEKEAITAEIISLAHKLGHTVIAEGVEHENQYNYLKKYQCDKIQGFLFSKPLDIPDALALLKQTNRT
ncbi:EAL domain-containing protein [uncultured Sphaerochaeta sp.]|uniref:EAL domain-containing protein n=1 Tax=uncultured Sphaerochaeta sp. TaxID=886478 RepID=UPI002A0A604B|nr:EAL domain-containing protein [uncultured Sphaerochaeta sp.]